MILEHAIVSITPGQDAAFESAFANAPAIFERAAGCHGAELRHCVETPGRYLLLVHWETVEHHTVGFRESPLFGEWRALVGPYFAAPPAVEHYEASL